MSDFKVERKLTIGLVGLGRMGANMARRLSAAGHHCVVWDQSAEAVAGLQLPGVQGAAHLDDLLAQLPDKKIVWMMVPAAFTEELAGQLGAKMSEGDILIDGGNSHYRDAIDRAEVLALRGIDHIDVGTSGGVHGLERGYCLMIGGEPSAVGYLEPVFRSLAPGVQSVPRTLGREGSIAQEEHGYLHCGAAGAGHFVKMVHNGIEYGLMAAYGEGFNILRHADIGNRKQSKDAETAPLRDEKYYQFDFELDRIAELWRRGSVIPSWLLDLTARALLDSPELSEFSGQVSDSGEGRWTQQAAIDEGVPAHVLSAALFDRFESRGRAEFSSKILSAMRLGFGGHQEKKD